MVSEDEELCAVEDTSDISDADDADSYQRLYARQQISFTVCSHAGVITITISTGFTKHRYQGAV